MGRIKFSALLFLAIALAVPAFARLGETKDQIYKRYGAVQRRFEEGTNEWAGAYRFKDYGILVTYSNNISVSETVKPNDQRRISDAERESLLKAIGGEGTWKESYSEEEEGFRVWTNTTAKAMASEKIINDDDVISITTPENLDSSAAQSTKKEKARVDGF